MNRNTLCGIQVYYLLADGQGESGMVKLSHHSTGRLIAIKNVSKWRENVEVSGANLVKERQCCMYAVMMV